MTLLDTDHLSVLRYADHPRAAALRNRLRAAPDRPVAVTVISLEEQVRGWLNLIARAKTVYAQLDGYERLARVLEFFREWGIVAFDRRAADEFIRLRKQFRRLTASDLKIAAIAPVNNALLLSANLRDFRKVPGLRVEDWLREDRS